MNNYIIFYTYEGFNSFENALMSLIVGFNKSKRKPCFTNKYAGLRLGATERSVSTTINKFIEKGFIKTTFNGSRRFISILKEPEIVNLNEDLCETMDVFTVENNSTPIEKSSTQHREIFYPDQKNILGSIENISGNNKEYIKDNNINNNIDNNINKGLSHKCNKEELDNLIEKFIKSGMTKEEAKEFATSTLNLS